MSKDDKECGMTQSCWLFQNLYNLERRSENLLCPIVLDIEPSAVLLWKGFPAIFLGRLFLRVGKEHPLVIPGFPQFRTANFFKKISLLVLF